MILRSATLGLYVPHNRDVVEIGSIIEIRMTEDSADVNVDWIGTVVCGQIIVLTETHGEATRGETVRQTRIRNRVNKIFRP